MSEEVEVSGKIVFDDVAKPFRNATLYVSLEDISKQNASSETIASQTIRKVSVTGKEWETRRYKQIDFVLRGKILDNRGMYVVSAHVDVDGDGRMSIGDYITQEYYPVLTRGNPKYVVVHVKAIT